MDILHAYMLIVIGVLLVANIVQFVLFMRLSRLLTRVARFYQEPKITAHPERFGMSLRDMFGPPR